MVATARGKQTARLRHRPPAVSHDRRSSTHSDARNGDRLTSAGEHSAPPVLTVSQIPAVLTGRDIHFC